MEASACINGLSCRCCCGNMKYYKVQLSSRLLAQPALNCLSNKDFENYVTKVTFPSFLVQCQKRVYISRRNTFCAINNLLCLGWFVDILEITIVVAET